VKTAEAIRAARSLVADAVADARAWLDREKDGGLLVGPESRWTEAYHVFLACRDRLPEAEQRPAWARIATALVFDRGQVPRNQRTAAAEACELIACEPDDGQLARRLHDIAERHGVDPWKLRSLLGPGVGCPWLFPRALWSHDVVVESLAAILAPFDWTGGEEPDAAWLAQHVARPATDFVAALEPRAQAGSLLGRAFGAIRSLTTATEREHTDLGVLETHAFVGALAGHGLSTAETDGWCAALLDLREAVVLQHTFNNHLRAEHLVRTADAVRDRDPKTAHGLLNRAANLYQRITVAQQYTERLIERHRQIVRMDEDLRAEHGLPDDRKDHVLLISTYQSPGDLQRMLLSAGHELMGFAYGRDVRLVVFDDSTGEARATNERIYAEVSRIGLNITVWNSDRRDELLTRLNEEVFPDGSFDVADLAGQQTAGEKGVPYGRIRNFLRLVGLIELRENGLDEPIFTWLDQDNELGALVLARDGRLAKRHVFNYFDQKAGLFSDPKLMVGGGGYTNDALEGVEKFWVAWGILHTALGLAQEHAPHDPAVLQPAIDITRFRPWDQPDTLERLPREGEDLETMSDQFLLLLNTLIGTFRGKYDNQVQIYHPWTYGYVDPEQHRLVEDLRPFAGMPGGNTSVRTDVLASPIPFITVGGRGEDIFHLWQLEGAHGPGSVCLTHTPALHTRNVTGGRGDLMAEIVNSFNGRIFREPPYLWAAMSQFFADGPGAAPPGPDVEADTAERIEGLRNEAMANIETVSGFAREIEPYVNGDNREFWWLAQAEDDPRCAALLTTLRTLVADYKDAARHRADAEQKLIGLDEVKDLTARFLAAYPHWETVVEHVSGLGRREAGELASLAGAQPLENYGSALRTAAQPAAAPAFAGGTSVELSALAEPLDDPPWHEVYLSPLLLFRRYETGQAMGESWLDFDARVTRLRALYDHHAPLVDDVPSFVWTLLYRDALFVPGSAPYRAVTDALSRPGADVAAVAAKFGVDERLLAPGVAR